MDILERALLVSSRQYHMSTVLVQDEIARIIEKTVKDHVCVERVEAPDEPWAMGP